MNKDTEWRERDVNKQQKDRVGNKQIKRVEGQRCEQTNRVE